MKIDAGHIKFAVFASSLVVIAAIINSLLFIDSSGTFMPPTNELRTSLPPSQSPVTSQPHIENTGATEAAAKAAAEKAEFLARYVNGGSTRQAGKQGVAIVVAGEAGKLNPAINTALARRFQSESVQIFPSFFTQDFISDGLFNDAVTGSTELFRKLELAGSVSALILAREEVQYAQDAALENVITATIRLVVTAVPVSGQGTPMTWTFTANGPGFTKVVAREAAVERIIKQIASDTKMSLAAIIPDNQNH